MLEGSQLGEISTHPPYEARGEEETLGFKFTRSAPSEGSAGSAQRLGLKKRSFLSAAWGIPGSCFEATQPSSGVYVESSKLFRTIDSELPFGWASNLKVRMRYSPCL